MQLACSTTQHHIVQQCASRVDGTLRDSLLYELVQAQELGIIQKLCRPKHQLPTVPQVVVERVM